MKTIKPLAVLVSLGIGVLLAPTAVADDKDDLFLLGLESESIDLPESTALAAAHQVCTDFASGATQEEVVLNTMASTGLSLNDAGFLGGAAIYAYCPQYESRIH